MDVDSKLLQQLRFSIVDSKFDEPTQSGVRVLKNEGVSGVLFQIQRVIIRRGLCFFATGSKLEADNEVFPQLY